MSYKDASGDKVYTLDIPQLEGKEGYIGTFFTLYLQLGNLFKGTDFAREPVKVSLLVRLIISMIPDKDRRDSINKTIKERFEQLKKEKAVNGRILTDGDTGYLLIEASLDALGNVTDYIDKHIGLNIKNKIGYVRRMNNNDNKQEKELPEEKTISVEIAK